MKSTLVVSDVHLGSRHCRAEAFLRFLDALPLDADLILNGDILDFWRPLPPTHAQALERLKTESLRGRTIVWISGNNDAHYRLPDPGAIRFVSEYIPGTHPRVFMTHGDAFDRLLHGNILCTVPFRILHRLRQLAGRPSMHVAQYARRWTLVYGFLKGRIVRNAVRYARQNGFDTIVCGHTHYAEEQTLDSIRYLNTGSWTEDANHYAEIIGSRIELHPAAP